MHLDRGRLRAVTLSVVLWLFGLATTVTLISTWGRAVASDPLVLDDAARELATSRLVTERLISEMNELAPTGPRDVASAVSGLVEDPLVELALENIMSDIVVAATATDGRYHRVDIAERLLTIAPVVAEEARAHGLALDAEGIADALSTIEPIDVRAAGQRPIAGPGSSAAGALSLATMIGLAALVATGGSAVGLSEDRRSMARSLVNRILVSALSFTVMLRVGAWVTDPGGGRAPVRAAISTLVGAKTWIPLLVAVTAGAVAGAMWLSRRGRTQPRFYHLRAVSRPL